MIRRETLTCASSWSPNGSVSRGVPRSGCQVQAIAAPEGPSATSRNDCLQCDGGPLFRPGDGPIKTHRRLTEPLRIYEESPTARSMSARSKRRNAEVLWQSGSDSSAPMWRAPASQLYQNRLNSCSNGNSRCPSSAEQIPQGVGKLRKRETEWTVWKELHAPEAGAGTIAPDNDA
jgi:hypothetical protein